AEQQRPALGRTSTRPDHALVLFEEAELAGLLIAQELGVAHILALHPPHHLARAGLDLLAVAADALEPAPLVYLVDEIRLQRLLAKHVQDVVRIARTVHQRLARADALAFLDVHVDATRQRVLARLRARFIRHDDDLPLALDHATVLDDAIDFRDD